MLSNPKSGSGKAVRLAERAVAALSQAGCGVKHLEVGGEEKLDAGRLSSARALVVVGGDGTVLGSADAAAAADCPLYHLPTGNENLFSREFGMSDDVDLLVRAVAAGRVRRVDIGRVCIGETAEPFLLMCSVGPDASVIRRLARTRRRATGHRAYVGPVLGEALRPMLPRITLEVDGRRLLEGERGWVIVANCAEYALRLNPARDAVMSDGLLDVVFMPSTTTVGALRWLVRFGRRRDLHACGATVGRGSSVRLVSEQVHSLGCYQVDGEAGRLQTGNGERFELVASVLPANVPVLCPFPA